MIINWFSKTRKQDNILIESVVAEKEYASIFGIAEIIEFDRNQKEINGVLLDAEGRQFEFKITPNGDLLRITGIKEDLLLAWHVCADYLKQQYSHNEINELRKELRSTMQQLQLSINELKKEIESIELPEFVTQAIPQVQSSPAVNEIENLVYTQIDEDSFEEEENPLQFEDFSDEDLSSHALKVLNGEISINA